MRKPSFYPSSIAGTPEDGNYPYGQYKDAKNGAGGTMIEAAHVNDLAYAMLTVLKSAGVEPDDAIENAKGSQFLQALEKLYNIEWTSDKAIKGYKVGARVLQNGIEYINQKDNNTSNPAAQTVLLGTNQKTGELLGNGWQMIKDHNTGQTLQNWLMPGAGEAMPYLIKSQDKQTDLLTIIPAPKIESFLYEPQSMDEVAKLGYFPLTLNANGTAKEFVDTNNILSSTQKEILKRYVSKGYIKLVGNAYSIALANVKAGFGLVGFGGTNPIGTPTGGSEPPHTHFSELEQIYKTDTQTAEAIYGAYNYELTNGQYKGSTDIKTKNIADPSLPIASSKAPYISSATSDNGNNRVRRFGRKAEKWVDGGGDINYTETPVFASGLQVCYGIPISTAYRR